MCIMHIIYYTIYVKLSTKYFHIYICKEIDNDLIFKH